MIKINKSESLRSNKHINKYIKTNQLFIKKIYDNANEKGNKIKR